MWGKAFQAEGTASAKALRKPVLLAQCEAWKQGAVVRGVRVGDSAEQSCRAWAATELSGASRRGETRSEHSPVFFVCLFSF